MGSDSWRKDTWLIDYICTDYLEVQGDKLE